MLHTGMLAGDVYVLSSRFGGACCRVLVASRAHAGLLYKQVLECLQGGWRSVFVVGHVVPQVFFSIISTGLDV
jgi:hypothetical protein